ncbi:MAG: RNA-binding protein [Acidobacteria bacterium]|nr:RNA-binding protein [Acidobacteriota bacterium]
MAKLYVGNIPYQVSENDLQNFCEQAGVRVESVRIIRDRDTGTPRGFGFVELASGEDLNEAITRLNGKELEGRNLQVNEARPERRDREPRSGGGGGFGGRGRGGYGGGRGGRQRY